MNATCTVSACAWITPRPHNAAGRGSSREGLGESKRAEGSTGKRAEDSTSERAGGADGRLPDGRHRLRHEQTRGRGVVIGARLRCERTRSSDNSIGKRRRGERWKKAKEASRGGSR